MPVRVSPAAWRSLKGSCGWAISICPCVVNSAAYPQKRPITRGETTRVCPSKSVPAVLLPLKAAGQKSRVTLIAHGHSHQRPVVHRRQCRPAVGIEHQQNHHASGHRGRKPWQRQPQLTMLAIPSEGRSFRGRPEQFPLKAYRRRAGFPGTQLGFQGAHLVHNSLLSNRREASPGRNDIYRLRCWAKSPATRRFLRKCADARS